MLHMRRGDVLSVRLTAAPGATSAELRAIERAGGTLSIELCMRKRKRVDDFAEEGESPAVVVQTSPALAAQGRATSKASRRRERKRRAAGQPSPATRTTDGSTATDATAQALEPSSSEMSAGSESDHTGSDTEWSEGFSSDDEERRKARPPKRMRRLAREIRDVQVAASSDNDPNSNDLPAFRTDDGHVTDAGCGAVSADNTSQDTQSATIDSAGE